MKFKQGNPCLCICLTVKEGLIVLFTSYEFLAFFAVLLILYYVIPKRGQWMLLLAGSYIFYAFSGWTNLVFILVTTLSTFIAARRIAFIKNSQGRGAKSWLVIALFLNLAVLFAVKFLDAGFSFWSFRGMDFVIPLGISFYMFQSLGYLIDVYRGKYEPEKNLFRYALFVSFFPQLIQGPISRFDDLKKTLFAEHKFDTNHICRGLQRILWGFFKKLVIANRLEIANEILFGDPSTYQGGYAFLGMLFYALQLFADFTGGIDITIGIAQCFGIEVTENFIRPFFSKNIKEYWTRWHITMGSWFKDYVFYPLSTSEMMLKLRRFSKKHFSPKIAKRVTVYVCTLVVWLATGIWHGVRPNYVVWGLLNGVIILISYELEPLYEKFRQWVNIHVYRESDLNAVNCADDLDTVNRVNAVNDVGNSCMKHTGYKIFQVIRTLLLMSCIRMLDCYKDVATTFWAFISMFQPRKWNGFYTTIVEGLGEKNAFLGLGLKDYIVVLCGVFILVIVSLCQRKAPVREQIACKGYPIRFAIWFLLFLLVVVFGVYGIGFEATQFIYNQF